MDELKTLLENNRIWSEKMRAEEPDLFPTLQKQQNPEYLWIGCADSRVPSNQIVGLLPGNLFVHRNVANQVIHTDLNCLSVVQYAVEILKVKHLIVCGHYGCGGVEAGLTDCRFGLIDNWVLHIRDIYLHYKEKIDSYENKYDRLNKLCEINVVEQVRNLCRSSFVRDAWKTGNLITVHGWIYSLDNGLINDLKMNIDSEDLIDSSYDNAVSRIFAEGQ